MVVRSCLQRPPHSNECWFMVVRSCLQRPHSNECWFMVVRSCLQRPHSNGCWFILLLLLLFGGVIVCRVLLQHRQECPPGHGCACTWYVCMYVSMYVCMCVCVFMCACIYVHQFTTTLLIAEVFLAGLQPCMPDHNQSMPAMLLDTRAHTFMYWPHPQSFVFATHIFM